MNLLEIVKTRRSVRKYLPKPIDEETVLQIIEYGRWAPSGLNHQPWKMIGVLNRPMLDKLAKCTTSGHMIENAPSVILIYLDKSTRSYSYAKNCQGIGALFQNMLLGIHQMGLGACWLGEILNQKDQVNALVNIHEEKDQLEFMGGIVLGYPHPDELKKEGSRKPVDSIFEFWSDKNE